MVSSAVAIEERLRTLSRFVPSLTFLRSMGGGPRTFPGGLSKWQFKRMHEKLAREKQRRLLQQEKQLYQARLRSEIRAKVAGVPDSSAAPGSVVAMSSKDHIKALADRFMKAGAEDLWNEDDGPVKSSPVPRQSRGLLSVPPPVDLRKIAGDRHSLIEDRGAVVGSFDQKRWYSVTTVRGENMRLKTNKWKRNSSSEEDEEGDFVTDSEWFRDAGGGSKGNSRLFPRFSSGSDGESIEESNLENRTNEMKKMFSRAALRNHDVRREKRLPRQIIERGEFVSEIQGIQKEWQRKSFRNEAIEQQVEEEQLLTKKRFDESGISPMTIKALAAAGHTHMTIVQEAALNVCLEGKDALVKAKTGTGKSIAFLTSSFLPLKQSLRQPVAI